MARYPGSCRRCGEHIRRGDRIFVWSKSTYSGACAEDASSVYQAALWDELVNRQMHVR